MRSCTASSPCLVCADVRIMSAVPHLSVAAMFFTPFIAAMRESLSALVAITVNGMSPAYRKFTMFTSSAVGAWRTSTREKACAQLERSAKKSSISFAQRAFSALETLAKPYPGRSASMNAPKSK